MKKIPFFLIFLLMPLIAGAQILSSYSELYDDEQTAGMRAAVEYLSSLEGRGAGSQGEEDAADYISKAFEEAGLDLLASNDDVSFGILSPGGDTIRSRNE